MQTFLPFKNINETASVLDYRRLGKQRVEALQIWDVLDGIKHSKGNIKITTKSWSNHPAVKMWANSIDYLKLYGSIICQEWIRRGYKDNLLNVFGKVDHNCKRPFWYDDERIYLGHKSNLLRKDYAYYSKYFIVPDDIDYFWPVA